MTLDNPSVVMLLLLLILMTVCGFYVYFRRRLARATRLKVEADTAPLPEGVAEACTSSQSLPGVFAGSGSLMLVGYGSFGANLVLSVLTAIHRSGLERAIGSILLIEFDQDVQLDFNNRLPDVFKSRLVMTEAAALAGGFGNRPIVEVEGLAPHWTRRVIRASEEIIDRHRRLSPGSAEPAQVICFTSPGPTGYTGHVATRRLRQEFPVSQFIGLMAYSHVDRMRGQIKEVIESHLAAGMHGFVVADNLRDFESPDRVPELNDFAMLCTILALLTSTKRAAIGTSGNNLFRQLIPEKGGLASFRVSLSTLPAYSYAGNRHYVHREAVIDLVIRQLAKIDDVSPAVSARLGHDSTMRYDVVVTPIVPEHLRQIDTEIRESIDVATAPRRNTELRFSPVAMPISDTKPTCPIAVLSLQALTEPWAHLNDVSLGDTQRTLSRPNEADVIDATSTDVTHLTSANGTKPVPAEDENVIAQQS